MWSTMRSPALERQCRRHGRVRQLWSALGPADVGRSWRCQKRSAVGTAFTAGVVALVGGRARSTWSSAAMWKDGTAAELGGNGLGKREDEASRATLSEGEVARCV
jgi:hypothetical protein